MLWGAVDNTDPNNLMRRFGTCLATYSLEESRVMLLI